MWRSDPHAAEIVEALLVAADRGRVSLGQHTSWFRGTIAQQRHWDRASVFLPQFAIGFDSLLTKAQGRYPSFARTLTSFCSGSTTLIFRQ